MHALWACFLALRIPLSNRAIFLSSLCNSPQSGISSRSTLRGLNPSGDFLMLFKSALLTQASGSIGGITASRNRGGMYFRSRTVPTDPQTEFQTTIRVALGSLVNRWNAQLTQQQRDDWNLYATMVTLLGPLGDPVQVSGINHFVRSNVPRSQASLAFAIDAPTEFNTGSLSGMGINSATAVSDLINVAFDDTEDWNLAGGSLLIYVGRPQNGGISFYKGPFRFAANVLGSGPGVSPVDAPSPFNLTADQRIWVRARATYPDGRLTESQILGPEVVV